MEAEIVLDIEEKEVLYKALKPDVDGIMIDDSLKITIHAENISDLRAKLNSYLRLCEVALICIRP